MYVRVYECYVDYHDSSTCDGIRASTRALGPLLSYGITFVLVELTSSTHCTWRSRDPPPQLTEHAPQSPVDHLHKIKNTRLVTSQPSGTFIYLLIGLAPSKSFKHYHSVRFMYVPRICIH